MNPASDNIQGAIALIAENTLLATQTEPKHAQTGRPKGKSRRWRLMERRGYFGPHPEGVLIYRATTLEDLCGAFQLVHDNFVEQGYLSPHHSGLRVRVFETLPETATFVAKVGERIVGATSLVPDTPEFGLPLERAFPDEVDSLRCRRRRLSEGTNWVIDPEYRHTSILTELMRCCWAHAHAMGWHDNLAAISPSHSPFYKLLGFETEVDTPRSYSQEKNDPVVMERLPFDKLLDRFAQTQEGVEDDIALLKRYYLDDSPYHSHILSWAVTARAAFSDHEFLRKLFVERSNFLAECHPRDREFIRRYWGDNVFKKVWGHQVLFDRLAS